MKDFTPKLVSTVGELRDALSTLDNSVKLCTGLADALKVSYELILDDYEVVIEEHADDDSI
jgi:hypothetical protein